MGTIVNAIKSLSYETNKKIESLESRIHEYLRAVVETRLDGISTNIKNMNTNIEKLQSVVANQNKLLEKWLSEINSRVENLGKKLDEQGKKFSEMMLNAMALQLFYMYMTLYDYTLIELHKVGLHFIIVVEDIDSVLLTIVTNTISEDVEKQLEKLKKVLEMTLSKKIVYNVFTPI